MYARQKPPPDLLDLASCQEGMLTVGQVDGFGVSRDAVARLVAEGRWRRICPGLLYAHDLEPDWSALAWGGVVLGGDQARLGGAAAAHLWKLDPTPPDEITILIPHERQVVARAPWRFQRERPGVRNRSTAEPPRLDLVDTVIDRCGELDQGAAVDLLLKAVHSRKVTPAMLRNGFLRRPKATHRAPLLDVLTETAVGAASKLELCYLRDVERAHGLPAGRRQVRIRSATSTDVRDVRYDSYGLIVELDGRLGHDGMGRFRDMARDNRATLAGETTLRYGWTDVTERPCGAAVQVSSVLIDRGWTGVPGRCSRCRSVPDAVWGRW